jgi:Tfp pilus assembly protein PilZ
VAASPRELKVAFARPELFRREYESNLANGGVFVATNESFELREKVRVKLVLGFCRREIDLDGEVVHQVTREMAALGGPVGVAVSFDESAPEIRKRLAPLVPPAPEPPTVVHAGVSRRRAERAPARVAARIQGEDEPLAGRTRDLSRSGVLVSVPGRGIPVGQKVRIALTHPTSGEAMALEGTVVREIEGESGVSALAIRFDPAEPERPSVERFVEGLQSVEHARRLGGISGDVAEIGVAQLLQMLGSTADAGTVVLRRGAEEAIVGFEKGLLRVARLGPATGMKALVRLVGWCEGSFEFHARLDPVEAPDPPLPLAGAVLDAMLLHEEGQRPERRAPPPSAVPRLAPAAAPSAGADLGKLERAVLDLVQAGFPWRRILDVIPEPDPTILGALEALVDEGLVQI